ncbi:hypothetical protein [Pseudomonas phage D6]|nr:hypothetical protein [Pseudomonas phage D6]
MSTDNSAVLATVGLTTVFVWGMAKLGMRVTECCRCVEEYTTEFEKIRDRQNKKTITRMEALDELHNLHKRIERRYMRATFSAERTQMWLQQMYSVNRHLIILAEV